jgi:hypothetical protein
VWVQITAASLLGLIYFIKKEAAEAAPQGEPSPTINYPLSKKFTLPLKYSNRAT